MHRISERIVDGRDFRTNPPLIDGPQVLCGNLYILSKNTVDRNTQNGFIPADVTLTDAAMVAAPAPDMRVTGNQGSDVYFRWVIFIRIAVQILDKRTDSEDIPHEFMPQNPHCLFFF